jgi:mono/diheme cytochrome c family protein
MREQKKNFVLGFVAALVVLPLGSLAYFELGFSPMRSDVKPSALETELMNSAVRAATRRNASGLSAPRPASEEMLVAGGKLYLDDCSGCHGAPGKPVRDIVAIYPPAPQLPHVGTQYTEPEIYWIVKHGIRMTAMPSCDPSYSDDQLWALAGFLHRIKTLPPGVLQRIQTKNPAPQN